MNAPNGPTQARTEIRAFLIADVRGYTLFTQERGDEEAAKLAARFADISQEVVEARGGTLLELRGDEAMCVFASPREAIRAAADLQRRFVDETLARPELPLTVGIGLDAGEAVRVGDGYRGGALNLAARLCGQALAGEILASREITHLARAVEGVRYVDRGAMTFKNLPDPVSVVRVVSEEGDTVQELQPFARKPPAAPRSRRPWMIAIAALVALALALVAIPMVIGSDPEPITLGSNTVARLGTDASLELETMLQQRPGATALGFGSVWVTHPDGGSVERLDAETGSRTDLIEVGPSPSGITTGSGAVWVANAGDGTVTRIDGETGRVTGELPAGSSPSAVAFGDGALWVADGVGASLLRIDPTSGEARVLELAGSPTAVTISEDGIWAAVAPDQVVLVDPGDLSITLSQRVGTRPSAIVSAFGSIWVANDLDGTITRLDPSTGDELATIQVGDGPTSIAEAAGSIWAAIEHDDAIVEIDPATNTRTRRVPVGATAASLVAAGGSLWLAVGASPREHRGGTLTLSTSAPPFNTDNESLDPAVAYDEVSWGILTSTNDGLLAYERVGGPAGVALVPDLAAALPDVSADGLTYRFPLRPDIAYSTGEPVRPEDFRRGIERSVVLHDAGADLFGAIDGVSACRGATCDLAAGIEADATSVTFHLTTPDPDLLFKLALTMAFPVPADTPFEDQGLDALPATGPYMIEDATSNGVELVRNPLFEEWSGAAQPDGFVDAISVRFDIAAEAAFTRLTDGGIDVLYDPPRDGLATLGFEHPDQIVQWPGPFTQFVGFDVLQPPFDDVRVRRAVAFALDRERFVEIQGDTTTHRLTCQVVPPNFQGYLPYCPYTSASQDGTWTAPDLDRADALMRESGAVGTPVTVLAPGNAEDVAIEEYLVRVLDDLGFDAELEVIPLDAYLEAVFGTPAGSPDHPKVFINGWISDYPAAGSMIEPQFACDGFANTSGWCDEDLDRRMHDARALYTTAPGGSNRAWAEIDRELVDLAVQAPITNPVTTHAVSDRTGNLQVNPQWGLLLTRLWVR